MPALDAFLRQPVNEHVSADEAEHQLLGLLGGPLVQA
jgi:hypothetical protein